MFLSCTHCHWPVCRGLRKQEMRDCKGIKILLAICPSSHRSEDLLPIPEVLWNPRLSHVSFLLNWFCSLSFYQAGLLVTSTALGFLCVHLPPWGLLLLLCLASALQGPSRVVSARLNLRNNTTASWQIDAETMETVTDFIFLGSKVTADGDCSHEIKRCLCSLEEKLWPN